MYYRLNVDFSHKDDAKQHGARWDPVKKTWYYDKGDELPEGLKRYYVESQRPQSGAPDYIVKAPGPVSVPDFSKYRTVTELNSFIHSTFTRNPAFQNVLVKGEVANFTSPDKRGNYYFSLKDDTNTRDKILINCVLWASQAPSALDFPLKNGQKVALEGKVDFYEGTGRTQINTRKIYDIGAGEAALKLEMLRKKLEGLGWFLPELKKPLPAHPRTIGVVTSGTGQAIQDLYSTLKTRNPYIQMDLYPVNVQGIYAAPSIVKGIEHMDTRGYDMIVVGRGGGSDEELYVFNDEAILTAVHNAVTPIISAVGHTGNFTLIDAVSDAVAITPTDAISRYVPELVKDLEFLAALKDQFRTGAERALSRKREAAVSARVQLEQKTPAHRIHYCTEVLQKDRSGIQERFTALLHSRDRMISEAGRIREKHRPVQLLQQRSADLKLLSQHISGSLQQRFAGSAARFSAAQAALYTFRPEDLAVQRRKEQQRLSRELDSAVHSILERNINRFRMTVAEMNGLSPTAKLINGFGYITHEDRPVLNVTDVQPGEEVSLTLHDGEILTEVQAVHKHQ